MKHLVLLLMSVLMPVLASAQDGLVAALYHGDNFKVYYSNVAFKNAMADAEAGDIITLSPGTFESTTINKAVTIRGAGIGAVDTIHGKSAIPTIIGNQNNTININVPIDSITGCTLNIEGVILNGSVKVINLINSIFAKTRLTSSFGYYDAKSVINNISFLQCVFDLGITLKTESSISVYNSVVLNGVGGTADISNSVIYVGSGYTSYDSRVYTYNNCIFVSEYSSANITSAQAFNCILTGKHSSSYPFGQGANTYPERQNKTVPEGEEIFVPGSFYELNENGKKYLGGDGTEVGIYGSRLPFSTVTSYPQIKKFSVAPESTTDGKLKIEFEIE